MPTSPEKPPETPSAGSVSKTGRNALVILAVIVTGAALHWLGDILTPLALAVFLAVMVDGFARVLREKAPIPDASALPVAIVLSILMFAGSAYVIADNASSFVTQLADYGPRLNAVIARTAGMLHLAVTPTLDDLFRQLNPTRYIGDVAKVLQSFASNAVFVLIYLGFILASRRGFRRKLVAMFPHQKDRADAVQIFQAVRNGVEQYLWIQTVTGLMIAAASWAVMAAVGLENAAFFAFLIFVVGYIPIVGGAVGILLPPLFALVQFDTIWPAVILIAVLQVINFVVGNIILPRMQGDSLNIDPVVVLLSLAFWGAIWGVPGMFLSTPLTVMFMVILAQFPGGRWIAVLLSSDGDPSGLSHHSPGPAGVDDSPKKRRARAAAGKT
ncbi:MAG: AI-2E family transporter [Caulobacterales bacterium]|nr:AI-2E family transporter [Caulobacterales bacterium]